jgi:hypothetical protein
MQDSFQESQLTPKEQELLTGVFEADPVVHINFDTNGTPWLATVKWEDDDFQLKKYRLTFTKRNKALYLSMPTEPGATGSNYFFAEIKPDHNGVYVWIPDADIFNQWIQDGKLRGTVKQEKHTKEILLDTPAVEILELITTNPAAIDYKNPLLFRKLK